MQWARTHHRAVHWGREATSVGAVWPNWCNNVVLCMGAHTYVGQSATGEAEYFGSNCRVHVGGTFVMCTCLFLIFGIRWLQLVGYRKNVCRACVYLTVEIPWAPAVGYVWKRTLAATMTTEKNQIVGNTTGI